MLIVKKKEENIIFTFSKLYKFFNQHLNHYLTHNFRLQFFSFFFSFQNIGGIVLFSYASILKIQNIISSPEIVYFFTEVGKS